MFSRFKKGSKIRKLLLFPLDFEYSEYVYGAIAPILFYSLTRFFPNLLPNLLFGVLLQGHIEFPRTAQMRALKNRSLYSTTTLEIDFHEPEIQMLRLEKEIQPVFSFIKNHSEKYFLEVIDHLVIQRMGINVFLVSLGEKSLGRSLLVDLTEFPFKLTLSYFLIETALGVTTYFIVRYLKRFLRHFKELPHPSKFIS